MKPSGGDTLRHFRASGNTSVNSTWRRWCLKGLEDKTYRGAVIASPSTPWGGGPNANEPNTTGYHAVWSRDLYHVATALDAIGDRAGANRLLDYLFNVQQKPDGSFPQNSWVDGRPIGNGLQMDQVAWPLILAYQLKRHDRNSWLKHIKPAADFILESWTTHGSGSLGRKARLLACCHSGADRRSGLCC